MLRNGERVAFDVENGDLVVRINGEIDHHSAVLVRTGIDEKIVSCQPKTVRLVLSMVDFMDSSGLGLIMGRYALVKKYGGELVVVDPSPAVQKIMKLAGMERLIPIQRTKEDKT